MNKKILGDVCIRCTEQELKIGLDLMYKGYVAERPEDCNLLYSAEECKECEYKEKCRNFWSAYAALDNFSRLETLYNEMFDSMCQNDGE